MTAVPIRFKDGVRLNADAPAIAFILAALNLAARDVDLKLPEDGLIITAGRDGQHMEGSKHYTDEAIDLRSHNFPSRAAAVVFVSRLGSILGRRFSVLFEDAGTSNEHFHIQVRKGLKFEADPSPSVLSNPELPA